MTVYFDFVQALVNFVASCPDDAERTDGFSVLQLFIDKFDDDGRFEILRRTITACPFRSIAGLLLHRLKEEIRLEYDSLLKRINAKINPNSPYQPLKAPPIEQANENFQVLDSLPPSVTMDTETIRLLKVYAKESPSFLQKKKSLELLFEVLEKNLWQDSEPISEEDVDLILYGLNLYYFLLLRDNKPNITGVMDDDFTEKMQDKIITPIRRSTDLFLEELNVEEKSNRNDQNEEDEDVDTDELNLSDVEEDEDMDELEREAIRELKLEIQEKKKKIFKFLPQQDRRQLQLRLFMLNNVIERINKLNE
jgi:hypothetical protein